MKIESPAELKRAFTAWRKEKRHVRETIPEELLERARRAVKVHGLGVVAQATKFDRRRLYPDPLGSTKMQVRTTAAPTFSHLELATPARNTPLAEVETPAGVKLRIFAETKDMLSLLSSICREGGER